MFRRKTHSLYGNAIQFALKNDTPWLKSEDLPSFSRFFVNWELIHEIHNNNNHLIVGRRGTGKTHLLGTFEEFVNSGDHTNEIAIKLSIMEATSAMQSPPIEVGSSAFEEQRAAKDLFEKFLGIFFNRFLMRVDEYLKKKLVNQINQTEFNKVSNEVNDLLTRLMEAIELGRPYHVSKKASKKKKLTSDTSGNMAGKVQLGLQNSGPAINIDASIGGKKGSEESAETVIEIESLLYIDLFQVRELILQILEKIKINVLYILIDEWMEIDKNTPSNKQAAFAQLLKMLFFNSGKFSIKIASVWHQTTLYDKRDLARSKGIQLKHDILMGADLDTAFLTDELQVLNFCKELLFKRLEYSCPDIADMRRSDGIIDDIFITELFDNVYNFKAFIAAAHGIPRDIMHSFQKCSVRINRDFSKYCVNYNVISEIALNTYKFYKRKNIDPSSSAQILLKQINKYLDTTGRRLFLVENKKAYESISLRKLVDEELIHQLPSAVTHRDIRDSFKAYHVDFGNFVDWIEAKQKDLNTILSESVVANFPANLMEDLDSYIIDVSLVDDDQILCSNCSHTFNRLNPIYVKVSICPKCAYDIKIN